MAKYKILDKKSFHLINTIARDYVKFNRSLQQEFIDSLPEEGCFPIVFSMIHEHIMGKPVEPHVRCLIAVKTEHGIDRVALDMSTETYNLLPEISVSDEPTTTNPQPDTEPENIG